VRFSKSSWILAVLASMAFAFCHVIAFAALAKRSVSGAPMLQAISTAFAESTRYAGRTLFLALPIVALCLLVKALAQRADRWRLLLFFCVFYGALAGLHWRGFAGAERALAEKQWTAAALSIGLLPFISAPVVAAACLAAWLMVRQPRR
jgi:hypothetical protein